MAFDILLSTVSAEFAKDHPIWGQSRQKLTPYLRRGGASVCVQEDFGQSHLDTLQKLDGYIRNCQAVVHVVGGMLGGTPDPDDLLALMDRFSEENRPLLAHEDNIEITDLTAITYTQWEALLAVHHGKPLFVYATSDGKTAQTEHLARLKNAKNARRADDIADREDLIGKVVGDLRQINPNIPEFSSGLPERHTVPLPRPAGNAFVGRENIVVEIEAYLYSVKGLDLSEAGVVLLHGIPGAGKSTVALELAYRVGPQFTGGVYWIEGTNEADLDRSYLALGKPEFLNLPDWTPPNDVPKTEAQFGAVSEQVRQAQRERIRKALERAAALVVFDGVDGVDARGKALADEYFPRTGATRIVLTTRAPEFYGTRPFRKFEVGPLDPNFALELLLSGQNQLSSVPDSELGAAGQICAEVGCLPLALQALSFYFSKPNKSFASYLPELKKSILECSAMTLHIPDVPIASAVLRDCVRNVEAEGQRGKLAIAILRRCSSLQVIGQNFTIRQRSDDYGWANRRGYCEDDETFTSTLYFRHRFAMRDNPISLQSATGLPSDGG